MGRCIEVAPYLNKIRVYRECTRVIRSFLGND